jgi:hypothetical protein
MSEIIYVPFISHLRIALDAHEKMLEYLTEHNKAGLPDHSFEKTAQGYATVVVVFCITALECYIYNYASRALGEAYAERHIEKLDLLSKWILVPKLATGGSIRSDHKGIQLLQSLIKARNGVVHLKGKNLKLTCIEEQSTSIAEANRLVLDSAVTAFQCIGELGQALHQVAPDEPGAAFLAQFISTPRYRLRCAQAGVGVSDLTQGTL